MPENDGSPALRLVLILDSLPKKLWARFTGHESV